MRRMFVLLVVAAALTSFTPTAGAVPVGVVTFEDYGRAQATESASLPATPGQGLVIASYTLAPRTDSGWRNHGGPAVLAITGGTLLVHAGAGCATKEYTAGQAAILPAGRHRLTNPGDQPLAFSGAFLEGANEITPFLDGADSPAPCTGLAGAGLAQGRASLVRSARGVFVGPDAYRHSAHAHHAGGIEVEAGKDILVTSYRGEYGSAGWMTHLPALGIITKGTLTYYEGHDGQCVKSGEFSAGQAYVHASPVTHLPRNDGSEAVEATYVYFNLPHRAQPAPVAGNQTDAVNFFALPPKDCPRAM